MDFVEGLLADVVRANVADAVSAPSPGEASVLIPTVRTARVAHVFCSASVGAPSAASRAELCIVAQC